MKKQQLTLLYTVFFLSISHFSLIAQGCSDAGFCSVSNGFINKEDGINNSVETGVVYGVGEIDVTIGSFFLAYNHSFSDKFDISTKLVGTSASGSFGTLTNIGDMFVTTNYNLSTKNSNTGRWSVFLGAKIPFTDGNDNFKDLSAPMPYQSSLGTFDAIGGVNLVYTKWDFNLSFQAPLTQNSNSFLNNPSLSKTFESTNMFERKADLLFRSGYKMRTANEKFTIKPNVLFIYHVGQDSFHNILGQRQNIAGSDGLTLNANLVVTYKLGSKSYLETSLAAPLVIREHRPDGLTRAFTAGLSYKINF